MSRYIGKRVSYPCATCGKQFTLNKQSIEDGENVFCSHDCYATHIRLQTLEEVEKELGELPLYQLPPGMIQVYGIDKKGMKYVGMAINPTDLTHAITKKGEV
jgi:DNA-directed RNA polymerase subunit RPC12/RpoP